jgi:hypothetical protein
LVVLFSALMPRPAPPKDFTLKDGHASVFSAQYPKRSAEGGSSQKLNIQGSPARPTALVGHAALETRGKASKLRSVGLGSLVCSSL